MRFYFIFWVNNEFQIYCISYQVKKKIIDTINENESFFFKKIISRLWFINMNFRLVKCKWIFKSNERISRVNRKNSRQYL